MTKDAILLNDHGKTPGRVKPIASFVTQTGSGDTTIRNWMDCGQVKHNDHIKNRNLVPPHPQQVTKTGTHSYKRKKGGGC